MYGHRYYGRRYFAPRYFGDGGAAVITPVTLWTPTSAVLDRVAVATEAVNLNGPTESVLLTGATEAVSARDSYTEAVSL